MSINTHPLAAPAIGAPMKTPKNSGKPWTPAEVKQLAQEAMGNTPTRLIALHLERSPEAVYSKASQEDISLKPTNQAPYNRKKKGK
jgi:hypothetical protein